MTTARPIAELLPHQGPALLLGEALEVEDDCIRCLAVVPEDSPFIEAGRVPAFLGIEMGAQAAALHDILLAAVDAPDKHGYIVAVRHARMDVGWIDLARRIEVKATRDGSAAPLYNYSLEVWSDGERVVEAAISTYVPE